MSRAAPSPGGDGRWLSAAEQRAWRALQTMHGRLSAELGRQLAEESDLSISDYAVLVSLTSSRQGHLRAFELAACLGWEQSRLSHHLSRMADRSLVCRRRCATDQRGSVVMVTEEGKRQLAAAAPGHVAAVRRLFIDRTTPEELVMLARVAERVLEALEEDSPDPPSPSSA